MEEKDLNNLWNSKQQNIPQEAIEYELKLLTARINLFEHEKSARRIRGRNLALRYSAAAILLLFILLFSTRPDVPEAYISDVLHYTPAGQVQTIILPDSTIAYLNSESALISPEKFTSTDRIVYLIGEAYFKVAPDNKKPFKVKTHLMTIEALGTEFAVLAYPKSNDIRTTLVEGCVKVETTDKTSVEHISKILYPNQQSYYTPDMDDIIVCETNLNLYTSWIDKKLTFENIPFESVIERLEIQFGKNINYSETLKEYNISAKFIHDESLEEILTLISHITYSGIKKTNNGYLIEKSY